MALPLINSFTNSSPENTPSDEQLMIGYKLENTLTENGSVARGICEVDDEGFLTHIVERRRIFKREHGGAFTEDDGKTFIELPKPPSP